MMKFSIPVNSLRRNLKYLKQNKSENALALASNSVLIEAQDDLICLTTANMDCQTTIKAKGHVEREGRAVLKLSNLIKIITGAKLGQTITLIIDEGSDFYSASLSDNPSLIFKGRIESEAADFPVKAMSPFKLKCNLTTKEVEYLFKLTKPAICHDEFRFYLSGVYLEIEKARIYATSTDGHRLNRVKINPESRPESRPSIGLKGAMKSKTKGGVTIPSATVDLILAALNIKSATDDVGLLVGDGDAPLIAIYFNDIEIISKTIDGIYPNYRKVFPTGDKTRIKFDKSPLLDLTKSIARCAGKYNADGVKLEGGGGDVIAESVGDLTHDMKLKTNFSALPRKVTLPTIGLNVKYLNDALKNISGDTVCFDYTKADCPVMMCEKTAAYQLEQIVMPQGISK